MSNMDPDLKAKIEAHPELEQAVIITAVKGGERKLSETLREANATEILPGLYKGQIKGERLLELEAAGEVEAIEEDSTATALDNPPVE